MIENPAQWLPGLRRAVPSAPLDEVFSCTAECSGPPKIGSSAILRSHDTDGTGSLTVLHELDSDTWQPYRDAYPDRDVERYLAVLAPDFRWVVPAERLVEGLAAYSERMRRSVADLPAGVTVYLDFRFTERLASTDFASERGIARMWGTGPRGPLPVRYTRFHTIARRDGGRWRLVVDYDAGEAEESEYEAADGFG